MPVSSSGIAPAAIRTGPIAWTHCCASGAPSDRSSANPGYLERPGRCLHRRKDARWSLQAVRSALWRFDAALVLFLGIPEIMCDRAYGPPWPDHLIRPRLSTLSCSAAQQRLPQTWQGPAFAIKVAVEDAE